MEFVPADVNWDEAHPHKQVNEHAEDDVACLIEILRDLPALEGQQETDKGQEANVSMHDGKAHTLTLRAL